VKYGRGFTVVADEIRKLFRDHHEIREEITDLVTIISKGARRPISK